MEIKTGDVISTIIFPIICIYGSILNLICLRIFSSSSYKKLNSKLSAYFRVLMINSTVLLVITAVFSPVRCKTLCVLSNGYLRKLLEIIIFNYASSVLFVSNCFVHISQGIYIYTALTKSFKIINRIPVKNALIFCYGISAFMVLPDYFRCSVARFDTIDSRTNTTISEYLIKIEKDNDVINKSRELSLMFFKLVLLVLCFLNIIIYYELKQISKMRKFDNDYRRVMKKNIKNSIMFMWTAFIYISIHLNYLIFNQIMIDSNHKDLFRYISQSFGYALIGSNFFIFYNLNSLFRRIFRRNLVLFLGRFKNCKFCRETEYE